MIQISHRWRNLPDNPRAPYQKEQSAILSGLNKSGKKIFDFGPGDLSRYKEDELQNTVAYEHLVQAAKEGWGMYPGETAPPGMGQSKMDVRIQLKEATCSFLKKLCDVDFSPEHIFFGHGVSGCFTIINNVLIDPGDEVLNIEPSHYHQTNGLGGVPIYQGKLITSPSDPDNRWEPDLEDLRKKINNRTKYIIVDHPQNPCAVIYSDKTLKRIIDIAGEYDLPLIVDEMYQLISYDGRKVRSVISLSGDVPMIMVQSTSKFWMMPGWSLGYACFHDPEGKMSEIEDAMMKHASYQGFASTRIPTPIMVAAARTFVDPKAIDLCLKMVKTVERRRDFTYKRLNEIEGISMKIKPEVTLYGLFRVDEIGQKNSRWTDDKEFSLEVLKREGLIFNTGSFFGPSAFGHCRTLLYRSIQTQTEGYDQLERFMKSKK